MLKVALCEDLADRRQYHVRPPTQRSVGYQSQG